MGKRHRAQQPKGVKPKKPKRKLRSDVNWQGALKLKGAKQTGVQPGLAVLYSGSAPRKIYEYDTTSQ
jgi:hypothetical protein